MRRVELGLVQAGGGQSGASRQGREHHRGDDHRAEMPEVLQVPDMPQMPGFLGGHGRPGPLRTLGQVDPLHLGALKGRR